MENGNSQLQRSLYISWLYVLSAIAVVILHANGSFWQYRSDYTWAISNVVECVFYFAVPVFFMLTGATLFDYTDKYTTRVFFQKRFTKTVIPFVFWGVFALVCMLVKNPESVLKEQLGLDMIFNGIFAANYVSVFWFFIPLFGIYLCIPLFANIPKDKKLRIFSYLACVAFILNVFAPFVAGLANAFFNWSIVWKYSVPALGEYLIYPVIGYLLHHCPLNKKQRAIIYLGALLGLGMHIFGTYYLSEKHGIIHDFFKGYLKLPCVLYSVGVYVFVKYGVTGSASAKLQKFVSWFQGYTFGIYLLHMLIFGIIANLLSSLHISDTSQLFTVLMTVINISGCIFITYILRKIPIIKVVVP